MEKKSAGFSKLAIIIPTHNRKKELKNLLDQIDNQNVKGKYSITTIVVVDGSTDGTVEMLEIYYPNIQIVHGDGNWWYTKSMNEGFKYALKHINPEFVLTLNDDVELAENYIEELKKVIDNTDGNTIIGSLGITKNEPHRMVTSGNKWRIKSLGIYKSYIPFLQEVNPSNLSGLYPSVTLPGRGMIIPANIIQILSGFDERFKQYHSDSDFCLRAQIKGYNVYITWGARIAVYEKLTGTGTSYLHQSFGDYLKTFFVSTSRNYVPSISRFKWRHHSKLLWPLNMLIFLSVSFKNYLCKRKI